MLECFKLMDEIAGQMAFSLISHFRRMEYAMEKQHILLDVQRRIEEIKGKRTECTNLTIIDGAETPSDKPQVGIWWLYKGRVIQHSVAAATRSDSGDPQCVEVQHSYAWSQVQQRFATKIPEILELRYDDVSHGRVWFHREFKRFAITCAPVVANDPAAVKLIARAFGIGKRRYCLLIDPPCPSR